MTQMESPTSAVVALSPETQDFGDNPVKQRQTDNYAHEYIKGLLISGMS